MAISGSKLLMASALAIGLAGSALAQTPPPRQPGLPPAGPIPPERIEKTPAVPGNTTGGVVTPPRGVDPGIQAPVPNPDPHTTPVIPPPGSPGGDPNVQPK